VSLDSFGFAIVSVEVWQKIQTLFDHGFELANEVEKPPAQKIAVGFAGNAVVVDHAGKEIVRGNF
jgi:hypothetical protein